MEKIVCPIDPRLSCGDANQFIARCSPKTLLVPFEFTVDPAASNTLKNPNEMPNEYSHFSRVLPLHELTAAKPKTELVTVPMRVLEPIVLDKSQKYIDGKLDPSVRTCAARSWTTGLACAGLLTVCRAGGS